MNQKEEIDYVVSYKIIILIITLIVMIAGFFTGFEYTSLTNAEYTINIGKILLVWGVGSVLILLLNILKDILNELRILNFKIK